MCIRENQYHAIKLLHRNECYNILPNFKQNALFIYSLKENQRVPYHSDQSHLPVFWIVDEVILLVPFLNLQDLLCKGLESLCILPGRVYPSMALYLQILKLMLNKDPFRKSCAQVEPTVSCLREAMCLYSRILKNHYCNSKLCTVQLCWTH